jgi:hypothetical protein
MKLKFLKAAFASLLLSSSFLANAALIFSDYTDVTQRSQDDSETFNVTGFEAYTNLVFTVNARGDYGTSSEELIKFSIDDMLFGAFDYNTSGSVIGDTGNKTDDYILNFSFAISDADWNTFTSDSLVKVEWDNDEGVDARSFSYVSYSLSGQPVPEPSTIAIFALGIMGLASRRFIK